MPSIGLGGVSSRGRNLKERTAHRIAESFKDLHAAQCFCLVNAKTTLTLEQTIIRDLERVDLAEAAVSHGTPGYDCAQRSSP